jgi:hypothetical protein
VTSVTTVTLDTGAVVLAVMVDMGGEAGPVRVLSPYVPFVGDTVEILEVGGDYVVIGQLAGGEQHHYLVTSVESLNTTLADALTVPLEGTAVGQRKRYKIRGELRFSGPAAADMQVRFRFLLASVSFGVSMIYPDISAAAGSGPPATVRNVQSDTVYEIGTDTAIRAASFSGVASVSPDSPADVLRVQFAQRVVNATPVIMQAGSHLIVERLANV